MDDSDAGALVNAALQNDDEAARKLVRRLYPLVARIVRAHRPRRTAEEDICQMIFIKVFQELSQFSGNVPMEHWVARVAVNTWLNQVEWERGRRAFRGDAIRVRHSRGRALARRFANEQWPDATASTRGCVISGGDHYLHAGNGP